MRWLFLGGLTVLVIVSAAATQTYRTADGSAPAARPTLGFDDSPDPEPAPAPDQAGRPRLGFDDSPGPVVSVAETAPATAAPAPVPAPPVHSVPAVGCDAGTLPGCGGCTTCPPPACCSCDCRDGGPVVWLDGEALLWWQRDSRLPPLVTTSPQASLGVLGRPGTRVLFGGTVDDEERTGGRFRAGVWLDDERTWGLESAFLFLGERSARFSAGSAGAPLLARPFVDAGTGQQDAEQVANLAVPSLPLLLPLTGRVTVTAPSRLWGVEADGVRALARGCSYGIDLLGGFRYLRLDEGLAIAEDLRVPAGAAQEAGTHFLVDDDFGTRNHFYGGELGTRAAWWRGAWSLEVLGKVALGVSQQLADVRGSTQITTPGLGPQNFTGGLLALPSNIGHYSRDHFAVLPEAGVTLGYHLTDGLRATVGYSFLYWSSVARPGDQVDLVVNTAQLPPGTARSSAQPAFTFHGTPYWAQGASFGLEYQY
jgi:hypothetical protein